MRKHVCGHEVTKQGRNWYCPVHGECNDDEVDRVDPRTAPETGDCLEVENPHELRRVLDVETNGDITVIRYKRYGFGSRDCTLEDWRAWAKNAKVINT